MSPYWALTILQRQVSPKQATGEGKTKQLAVVYSLQSYLDLKCSATPFQLHLNVSCFEMTS